MPATHIKTMDSGKDSGYEDKQHNRHPEREQAKGKPPKGGFVIVARGFIRRAMLGWRMMPILSILITHVTHYGGDSIVHRLYSCLPT